MQLQTGLQAGLHGANNILIFIITSKPQFVAAFLFLIKKELVNQHSPFIASSLVSLTSTVGTDGGRKYFHYHNITVARSMRGTPITKNRYILMRCNLQLIKNQITAITIIISHTTALILSISRLYSGVPFS